METIQAVSGVISAVAAAIAVYLAWRAAQSARDANWSALEARRADERYRQRELLLDALRRVREMRRLESIIAPLEPGTLDFVERNTPDEFAEYQQELVAFSAFAQALPLESLRNVAQLSKEGARAWSDVPRLHNQLLACTEELGEALAELRTLHHQLSATAPVHPQSGA